MDENTSIKKCAELRQTALPVSASCYHDKLLYLRLSGNDDSLDKACKTIGGEAIGNNDEFWHELAEQQRRRGLMVVMTAKAQ